MPRFTLYVCAFITLVLLVVLPALSYADATHSSNGFFLTNSSSSGPQWTEVTLPSLPNLARHKAVIVETPYGETLCLIGGDQSQAFCYPLDASGRLDINGQSTFQLGKPLRFHAATTVGNRIYILGGYVNKPVPPEKDVICAQADSNGNWIVQRIGALPRTLMQHTAVTIGNKVYIIGGHDGSAYLANVWSADVGTDCNYSSLQWQEEKSLPYKVAGHMAASIELNGRKYIYVIGGNLGNNGLANTVLRAEVLPSGLSDWVNLGVVHNNTENMNGTWLLAGGISGEYLYVIGGTTAINAITSSARVYRAQIDGSGNLQWLAAPQDLPIPLRAHAVAVSQAERIYVAGGIQNSLPLNKVYFTPLFDLSQSKMPRGIITYDDTVTVTLKLENRGVRALGTLAITDTLEANSPVEFNLGLPDGCVSYDNTTINCSISDLGLQESKDLTFQAGISLPVSFGSAVASQVLAPAAPVGPDLSLTKRGIEPFAVAGRLFTYTLTIYNSSKNRPASNVILTDVLPNGVSFASASLTPSSTAPLRWLFDSISANSQQDIQLVVKVSPSAPDVLNNSAVVHGSQVDPLPSNNQAQTWTYVDRQAELGIRTTDSSDPVMAGDTLTYTLTITNAGPSDAPGTVITDSLPSGVIFRSATPAYRGINPLTWNVDLAAGSSRTITVAVTVDSGQGTICNIAGLDHDSDLDDDNNFSKECTSISSMADLSIDVTDTPNPVLAGEWLTCTIVISNAGPSVAQNTVLTYQLPSRVQPISITPYAKVSPSGIITWPITALTRPETRVFTIVSAVDSGVTGILIGNGEVRSQNTPDSRQENNRKETRTGIDYLARLWLSMSRSTDFVIAGRPVTYSLQVCNHGPSDAIQVELTDRFYSADYLSAFPPSDPPGIGNVTWPEWQLENGACDEFLLALGIASDKVGTLVNTAKVQSNTPDDCDEETCRFREDSPPIRQLADLAIDGHTSLDRVKSGDILTFTLEIINQGWSDARYVVVTDTLPDHVIPISPTVLEFHSDSLKPGAIWSIPIVARVASDAHGILVNTVGARNTISETDYLNNHYQLQIKAPIILTSTAIVCEGELWCQESKYTPVPFGVYLPILLK